MDAPPETAFSPDVPVHPKLKQFLLDYIQCVDDPNKLEEYARDFFTEDGVLIFGSQKLCGHNEITAFVGAIWASVESQRHDLLKVFPFGQNALEVMFTARFEISWKSKSAAPALENPPPSAANGDDDGKAAEAAGSPRLQEMDFAGHMHFVEEPDGRLKIDAYRIYLDSAALNL